MRRGRRGVAVLTVAMLIGGWGASAASAGAAVSWATLCAGYSGKSWYSTSSGIGYSLTVASDNDEVGAALVYYIGTTAHTHGNGRAERSRAVVPSGGSHQSYCGWTVSRRSNA
jgi:hypothetical protein